MAISVDHGAQVRTECGAMALDRLAIGHAVSTASGPRRVLWIGRRLVDLDRHPRPSEAAPVRIAAGSFGSHRPWRAIRVSPDQVLAIDDLRVPALSLVGARGVARAFGGAVRYVAIELEERQCIVVDGLALLSFAGGDRTAFVDAAVTSLHPRFVEGAAFAGGSARAGSQPCWGAGVHEERRRVWI